MRRHLALASSVLTLALLSAGCGLLTSVRAAEPAKTLNSIPLDGTGEEDIPASSRLVRDLVAAHPQEDLVICIAGCRPGYDRVIYAQPADPLAKKPARAWRT